MQLHVGSQILSLFLVNWGIDRKNLFWLINIMSKKSTAKHTTKNQLLSVGYIVTLAGIAGFILGVLNYEGNSLLTTLTAILAIFGLYLIYEGNK